MYAKLSEEQKKELLKLRNKRGSEFINIRTLKDIVLGTRCQECYGRVDIHSQRQGLDLCCCHNKEKKSLDEN